MRAIAVLSAVFAAAVVAHSPGAARPAAQLVASSYGNVVLLARDGTAVARLARHGDSPSWSYDGRVAFVRDGDVWVVGEDGRGLARVTKTAAIEESPDWSPDGTLVYASNRGGRFELWTQRVGGPARRLTHPPQPWQEDRSPQWSPDGRFVAFSSNRPSNFNGELYLVRADGGGPRRLTSTPGSADVLGDDGMPAWRPDGSGLVFVSNRDRNWELYALDLRTLATTRLTETPDAQESLPRLAPDGRYAFVVQLHGGRGRIVVADETLHGRTVRQAGTAVDWRPAAR